LKTQLNADKKATRTPLVRIGIYSLMVNLVLVAAKLSLSFITGSLALRADAIHSLVDVFASVGLIIGLVLSGRSSRNFPYGLYKVENVVAVIISLLLFFTAYEIIAEAIRGTTAGSYSYWVLIVMGVIVLIPFFFGRYELNAGKRYNSPSLIADGSQFRADVMGSSIVFIALLAQLFGLPLDRIAAGIVALFIGYAAWGLLVSSMRVLLDASVSHEILEKVRLLVQAQPEVGKVQDLVGRNSGRFIFMEATVTMRTTDLKKAHLVSQKIEQRIREAVPNIDRVLIHYEPETKVQERYAITLENREGQISEDFGKSSYFALVDIDGKQKKIVSQEIVANPYLDVQKGRGIKVAELLLTYKPDVLIAREELARKGPGYALDDGGVELQQTEAKSLDELLNQLTASKI
jgi:cation diffusion facilitator family transporter